MLCHWAIGSRSSERTYRLHRQKYSGPSYKHTPRHLVNLNNCKHRLREKFLISKNYAPHAGGDLEILTSKWNNVLSERIAQVGRRTRKNFCHRVPQMSVHMDQALRKYRCKWTSTKNKLIIASCPPWREGGLLTCLSYLYSLICGAIK